MKNTQIYRHGELIMKPVDTLPKGAKLENTVKKYIVAHSETGHHHVLVADKEFKVYSFNGESFIEIPTIAELRHEKTGKDVHKTHKITPSVYKIVLKKEFNYWEGLMKTVRD